MDRPLATDASKSLSMSFARWVLWITLGSLGAFLLTTFLLPQQYVVDRSVRIAATPEEIYPHLVDLEKWQAWNPWKEMDPAMRVEFGPVRTGVGASYAWQSGKVGSGSLAIVSVQPPTDVEYQIVMSGAESIPARGSLRLTPAGRDTLVLWSYTGNVGGRFFGRWITLFAESIFGESFDVGLTKLKQVVEADDSD
jgi:carbon monoxide dehydrogenase subunit G